MTAFLDNLKSFSKVNNLTPPVFSRLCNLSNTSIRNTLSKPDSTPRPSRVKVLAKFMQVAPDDLMKKRLQFKANPEIAKRVAELTQKKRRKMKARGVGRTAVSLPNLPAKANGHIDPEILAIALRKCGFDQADAAEKVAKVYDKIAAI
jgi:Glu-tRNA(Gln) amidotransferase subunit E-like FAD-binding protein